jgi:hypothetical protein
MKTLFHGRQQKAHGIGRVFLNTLKQRCWHKRLRSTAALVVLAQPSEQEQHAFGSVLDTVIVAVKRALSNFQEETPLACRVL